MIATPHTQSLADFRRTAVETLDRLSRTGEAEVLTVDGEARAVLLSPAAYDALARDAEVARDVVRMRAAIQQLDAGHGRDADAVFYDLRSELQAMKAGVRAPAAGQ